ncbi:MAG: PilW family protein [Gammaproteobacteria bacterium]
MRAEGGFTLIECMVASFLSIIILSFLISMIANYKKNILMIASLGHIQKNEIIAFSSFENDIKNKKIQFENNVLLLKDKNHQIQYFIADTNRKNKLKQTILGLYRYDSLNPKFAQEILEGLDHWRLKFTLKQKTDFLTANEVADIWEQVDGTLIEVGFNSVEPIASKILLHKKMLAYVQN